MNVQFVARKARWFIEDHALWLLPLMLAVGLGLGALLFSGDADCSEQIAEAEAAMVGKLLGEVTEVIVLPAVMQIQQLQAQLALAQANTGNLADAAIRPNEELGAYSDPAGEFYCFPVEGAGFD